MNNLPIAPLPGLHLLNRRSVLHSSMFQGDNQNVTEGNRKPPWDDRYRPSIFHATSRRMRSVAGIWDSWSILRGLGGGKCEAGGGNQGRGTSGDTMHLPSIVGFPSILERRSGCQRHRAQSPRKSHLTTKLFSKLLEVKYCMTTLRHQGALEVKSVFI